MPDTIPIIIKSIDGGMMEAVAPEAAKRAVAKAGGYFLLSISGIVVEPIAAVSALAEPQTPEKNIVERITTNPSPPRT
jgi:isopentenyl diphosphate isomerase/L-lactate dehydrogenase-like FMN-dependent dehydrogenase